VTGRGQCSLFIALAGHLAQRENLRYTINLTLYWCLSGERIMAASSPGDQTLILIRTKLQRRRAVWGFDPQTAPAGTPGPGLGAEDDPHLYLGQVRQDL
jgi:hypothetical protein